MNNDQEFLQILREFNAEFEQKQKPKYDPFLAKLRKERKHKEEFALKKGKPMKALKKFATNKRNEAKQ